MNFTKEIKKIFATVMTMLTTSKSERQIAQYLEKALPQFYSQFFTNNMIVNTRTVEKELLKISNFYKVPYKFNKDLFNVIKGRSLFSSDTSWTNAYTTKQINRLKSVVAKSLYEGKTEAELKNILSGQLKYSTKSAQLIARTERNRCLNTAKSMYFNEVDHDEYEKVWVTNMDGNEREEHAQMDGVVADENGYFSTSWGEYISEPGTGDDIEMNINCRCQIELRKIDKNKK